MGLKIPVEGRNILIVDDILETGQTLAKMVGILKSNGAAEIKVIFLNNTEKKICVCINKPGKLKADIKADYVGFEIEDVFVIGYGLDWDEKYRGLKELYIAVEE